MGPAKGQLYKVVLQFDGANERDRRLYEALKASAEAEYRTPLHWQVEHLLAMALALRPLDRAQQDRIVEAARKTWRGHRTLPDGYFDPTFQEAPTANETAGARKWPNLSIVP